MDVARNLLRSLPRADGGTRGRAARGWLLVMVVALVLVVALGDVPSSTGRFLLPLVLLALPSGLLRRRPLLAVSLMLAGAVVLTFGRSWVGGYLGPVHIVQIIAVDLAVGFIAANARRSVSVVAALLALAVQSSAVPFLRLGQAQTNTWVILVLAIVTSWMVGNSIRQRQIHVETLRAQASADAVTAERLRIAREVHDLIAHSVGIIAIQAGVGSRVMDTQPAEARKSLDVIEATSRETLAELRRTLGTLRRTESAAGSSSTPVDPAPGLADVDRLAATTMAAGVQVDMRWRGQRRPLAPDIELSAYRIIQEAITNVVRHAGTRHCRVTVNYREVMLAIDIIDHGRGCATPSGGYGLIGMRERVALLNGHFTAGPRPEGGFRVAVQLPVTPPEVVSVVQAEPVVVQKAPAVVQTVPAGIAGAE